MPATDITTDTSSTTGNRIDPVLTLRLLVVLTAAIPVILLALPVSLPIGPMYWDSHLYTDAMHRINLGQVPAVDFFAPVGALGYYLAAAVMNTFDNAQPVLAASWSIMIVTLPIMAFTAFQTSRAATPGAAWVALAVFVPFMIFSLLPFNTTPAYPFPAADGFAIYNRQTSQLLYVLVAACLFIRGQTALAITIAFLMTALFYVKITGFVAGGLVCMLTLFSGRIHWKAAAVSAGLFCLIAVLLEVTSGAMVSAYLRDIFALVSNNGDGFVTRMFQSASRTFGTSLPLALAILGAMLVWRFRLSTMLDHPATWLGVVCLAGLFFESQNTGGQELIMIWPVVIMVGTRLLNEPDFRALKMTVMALLAAAVLPMTMNTVQAASRAMIGSLKQQPFDHETLGPVGQLTYRPEIFDHAMARRDIYQSFPEAEQMMIDAGQLPNFIMFSDLDFQILHLQEIDAAVSALKRREAQGFKYSTIMTLDFANPFAALLDKTPPRHIAIGADPHRAVPPLDDKTKVAVANTDVVLIPTCPDAHNTARLYTHYAPALTHHKRHTLTDCYDMLVLSR